jgi:vacuolar-type H+-ATPase subunit H
MRKAVQATEEQSMIPAIQEVEAGCRRMLKQAREQAAAEVRDAEREAEELLRRARDELPLAMERRHREEVARLQAGLPVRSGGEQELALRAEANLERAVAAIISRVWAGKP